jgi:5-methylcytosine-specific restriction endonuclease McrA
MIRDLLYTRELSLTTIAIVASKLTVENVERIISNIRGKGKSAVRAYIDGFSPVLEKPRETIKSICLEPRETLPKPSSPSLFSIAGANADHPPRKQTEAKAEPPRETPPTEERVVLTFSVEKERMKKIDRARALLARKGGKLPSLEELMDAFVEDYLGRHDPVEREARREKRAARKVSSEVQKTPACDATLSPARVLPDSTDTQVRPVCRVRSRHIPKQVADKVFARDGLSCTYRGPDGTRCSSIVGLELDHEHPFAAGGAHDETNLKVLCSAHNRLRAEMYYGKEFMAKFKA